MTQRVRFLLFVLCLSLLPSAGFPEESAALAQTQMLAASEVVVLSGGAKYAFKVEVAVTPAQRRRGLMFRRELAADAGMLFDFPELTPVSFWMKNTLIPLDMLFIDSEGRILNIRERAVPLSLAPVRSAGPVRAVLEVNGGTVSRLGIRPGDRVLHPIFEPLTEGASVPK